MVGSLFDGLAACWNKVNSEKCEASFHFVILVFTEVFVVNGHVVEFFGHLGELFYSKFCLQHSRQKISRVDFKWFNRVFDAAPHADLPGEFHREHNVQGVFPNEVDDFCVVVLKVVQIVQATNVLVMELESFGLHVDVCFVFFVPDCGLEVFIDRVFSQAGVEKLGFANDVRV